MRDGRAVVMISVIFVTVRSLKPACRVLKIICMASKVFLVVFVFSESQM